MDNEIYIILIGPRVYNMGENNYAPPAIWKIDTEGIANRFGWNRTGMGFNSAFFMPKFNCLLEFARVNVYQKNSWRYLSALTAVIDSELKLMCSKPTRSYSQNSVQQDDIVLSPKQLCC